MCVVIIIQVQEVKELVQGAQFGGGGGGAVGAEATPTVSFLILLLCVSNLTTIGINSWTLIYTT